MKPAPTIASILHRDLEQRQAKNAQYSIRAFSRDLGVSLSFLSQVLHQKKFLSPAKAAIVSKKLKLEANDHDYFIADSILSSSRSEASKRKASTLVQQLLTAEEGVAFSKDEFKVISEWYHLAIFHCLFLKSHEQKSEELGEVNHLAGVLKILPEEVKAAIDRLVKLKIIAPNSTFHVPLVDYLAVKNKLPSSAIRKFHRQMIEKSLTAMQAQPVDERIFHTSQMTIARSDLAEISNECEHFFQHLTKKFARKPSSEVEADSVYAFSTQLFSLTHPVEKRK